MKVGKWCASACRARRWKLWAHPGLMRKRRRRWCRRTCCWARTDWREPSALFKIEPKPSVGFEYVILIPIELEKEKHEIPKSNQASHDQHNDPAGERDRVVRPGGAASPAARRHGR